MSPASITKIRSDREARSRRHIELARLLCDAPDATNIELAKALHVSRNTIAEDRKYLMSIANGEAKTEMVLYREQQLSELVELRDVLNDPKIKPDRKVELTLAIIDREMRLTGTAAPTKSIVGHVSGPKLDSLYLDVREVLLDLSDEDKHAALLLMREFAKQRKKPVVITAKFITEGEHVFS